MRAPEQDQRLLAVTPSERPVEEWPYYAKRVLSSPEQVLYHRLVAALPDKLVLAQVQVSRVLGVKRGYGVQEWNNRINRMSYDFVICAADASVIAVIELDDRSHEKASRQATDAKKDAATAAAGIRVLRWHVNQLPSETEIQRALVIPPPFK